jgi:hypothetical protein
MPFCDVKKEDGEACGFYTSDPFAFFQHRGDHFTSRAALRFEKAAAEERRREEIETTSRRIERAFDRVLGKDPYAIPRSLERLGLVKAGEVDADLHEPRRPAGLIAAAARWEGRCPVCGEDGLNTEGLQNHERLHDQLRKYREIRAKGPTLASSYRGW